MKFIAILLFLVASLILVNCSTVTKVTVERFCNQPDVKDYTCPASALNGTKEYNLNQCLSFNDICGFQKIPFVIISQNTTVGFTDNFIATIYLDNECKNKALLPPLTSVCGTCKFLPTSDSYLLIQCPQSVESSEVDSSFATKTNYSIAFFAIIAMIISLIL